MNLKCPKCGSHMVHTEKTPDWIGTDDCQSCDLMVVRTVDDLTVVFLGFDFLGFDFLGLEQRRAVPDGWLYVGMKGQS